MLAWDFIESENFEGQRSDVFQIIQFNPQVNLFTVNSIETIDAPQEIRQTWHEEQRSTSGGSKLIEQTSHNMNMC